jgi:hypothetical protein
LIDVGETAKKVPMAARVQELLDVKIAQIDDDDDDEKKKQIERSHTHTGVELKILGGIQIDLRTDTNGPGSILRLLDMRQSLGSLDYLHLVNVEQNLPLLNKLLGSSYFFTSLKTLSVGAVNYFSSS